MAKQLTEKQRIADAISRQFAGDPVSYARDYLGKSLWLKQQECINKLLTPPYRVLCRSANNVGKTFVAACTASWWHDNFRPSIVLTTAPTQIQVRDLLFKELRTLRPLSIGLLPRDSRIYRAPDWYVHGFTAATADAFQGRHAESLLLVFDEATGIRREFWERAKSMVLPQFGHGWLAIYNPNDISTPPYFYEQQEGWHNIQISALDHPNIIAELTGLAPPHPSAIRLASVLHRIDTECEALVDRVPDEALDFEFPRGSGQWYTPQTPDFEVQILGRWPVQPVASIWNEKMWKEITADRFPKLEPHWLPQIGADIARFGDDETTITCRIGPCVVHHEWHKGWDTGQTAQRLRSLAHEFNHGKNPRQVPILVDAGGVGGGVMDQASGYGFVEITSSARARAMMRYPNTRSELWFCVADLAKEGMVDVSRMSAEAKHRLKLELFAPSYHLDSLGRRVVEPKDKTKSRLGKSPDNADSFNLAFYVM